MHNTRYRKTSVLHEFEPNLSETRTIILGHECAVAKTRSLAMGHPCRCTRREDGYLSQKHTAVLRMKSKHRGSLTACNTLCNFAVQVHLAREQHEINVPLCSFPHDARVPKTDAREQQWTDEQQQNGRNMAYALCPSHGFKCQHVS